MANGSYGKCAGCGEMVIWVKTQAGKNMPCNPTLHNYKIDPTGKEKSSISVPVSSWISEIKLNKKRESNSCHQDTC